ncbi:MAG: quinolinate synthase NadA [Heliobacteriaceae bacterium]|nr:quinolinate synthase NadA [Heliobacteriaceae bacterium]MDD4587956.1 quinolinate synthase NadA [Heliobacteriaceae bacterium]
MENPRREEAEVFADWAEAVRKLKKKRNAVILAHLYQRPEIQEVADFVGDSLQLAQQAAGTDADVIVFCGVHFMAESAAILSPEKIVLLSDSRAGCPMAGMITAEALHRRKAEIPGVQVVTYVNSPAAVKAESDICCTSANAVKVVAALSADRPVLFVPDQNLGRWVSRQTGRELLLWPGYCPAHDSLTVEDIVQAQAAHPRARVIVHPECRPEVTDRADYVASTTGLVKYAVESEVNTFIVGTEEGILHQLTKQAPRKEFFLASQNLVCPDMKLTDLPKLVRCLETMRPRITVLPEIREKALAALERMLNLT